MRGPSSGSAIRLGRGCMRSLARTSGTSMSRTWRTSCPRPTNSWRTILLVRTIFVTSCLPIPCAFGGKRTRTFSRARGSRRRQRPCSPEVTEGLGVTLYCPNRGNTHEEPSHSAVQIGGGARPAAPSDHRLGRTHGGVRAGLVRLSQGRGRQHGRRALQSGAGHPLLFFMVSALVGGTARAPGPPCPVVGASHQEHP